MGDDLWIVVPNWDKFQHYSDRDPVWIKLYVELNSRDDWRQLTLADRGLLCSIWIEFAASNGTLRASDLPSRVRAQNVTRSLVSLNRAGLIQLSASKPLALTRSREKRREEKNKQVAHAPKKRLPFNAPAEPTGQPRTNAGAYHQFNDDTPDKVMPDPDILELARQWLDG